MDLPAIVRSQRRGQRRHEGHYIYNQQQTAIGMTHRYFSHVSRQMIRKKFVSNVIYVNQFYFLG